jgi:uncharacterized protein YjiK
MRIFSILKPVAFLLLLSVATTAVAQNGKPSIFPYDIASPYAYYDLPFELREISGLSLSNKVDKLFAVNDDSGQLFYIDKKSGKITPSITFMENGDFEGLEMVRDTVYALTSNGDIYKIFNLTPKANERVKVQRIRTNLTVLDNLEGLGYDPISQSLVIAGKGSTEMPLLTRKFYKVKLADLQPTIKFTDKVVIASLFEVKVQDFQLYLNGNEERHLAKLREEYNAGFASAPGRKKSDAPSNYAMPAPKKIGKEELRSFAPGTNFDWGPSSIAVHPVSGDLYVLSTINKVLTIFTIDGKIREMVKLPKETHFQPEGLCFDEDGTLYISNEGSSDFEARLFVFKMKK